MATTAAKLTRAKVCVRSARFVAATANAPSVTTDETTWLAPAARHAVYTSPKVSPMSAARSSIMPSQPVASKPAPKMTLASQGCTIHGSPRTVNVKGSVLTSSPLSTMSWPVRIW